MEVATDIGYQAQQATQVLHDGPDVLHAMEWIEPASTRREAGSLQNLSAGQAHAVALLTEAASFPFEDMSWEALRKLRGGAAQNRFARKYLDQVIAQPELMEGFSAVLSAALGAVGANGAVDVPVFGNALPPSSRPAKSVPMARSNGAPTNNHQATMPRLLHDKQKKRARTIDLIATSPVSVAVERVLTEPVSASKARDFDVHGPFFALIPGNRDFYRELLVS